MKKPWKAFIKSKAIVKFTPELVAVIAKLDSKDANRFFKKIYGKNASKKHNEFVHKMLKLIKDGPNVKKNLIDVGALVKALDECADTKGIKEILKGFLIKALKGDTKKYGFKNFEEISIFLRKLSNKEIDGLNIILKLKTDKNAKIIAMLARLSKKGDMTTVKAVLATIKEFKGCRGLKRLLVELGTADKFAGATEVLYVARKLVEKGIPRKKIRFEVKVSKKIGGKTVARVYDIAYGSRKVEVKSWEAGLSRVTDQIQRDVKLLASKKISRPLFWFFNKDKIGKTKKEVYSAMRKAIKKIKSNVQSEKIDEILKNLEKYVIVKLID